ncbi:MAG: FtsX-like permease family protein [Pseudomonadota bacterium]
MLFIHAWRNLWRNPRRAWITLAAVTANTAVLIATYALMHGLIVHAVDNATNQVTGEVQVHAPEYLSRRSLYATIPDWKQAVARMEEKGVMCAPRSYGFGLIARGNKSAGARMWGVDPKAETRAFTLHRHVEHGGFLSQTPKNGVVLGRKLARSLNAGVGDELVVVVQAADGSLGNDLYYVTGILKAGGEETDRSAAILHQADFARLFALPGRAHEIAANTLGAMTPDQVAQIARAAAPDMEVKTWRQLLPTLSDMVNLFDGAMVIFGSVFLLAGGLGVMNTMLMAAFERMREFGIMKALGASPWRIVRDVAAEALVLGALSAGAGAILGLAGSWYLTIHGIDTSAFAGNYTVAGVAFDPVWKAVITPRGVLFPVVAMTVISFLASLYPAALAARLDPVRAIHHV